MLNQKWILSLLLIVVLIGCATTKLNKDNQVSSNNSSNAVQPVDANSDGVIDASDIQVLMKQANAYSNENIEPLLKKTGIEIDEETGKVMGTPDGNRHLMEKNLSSAEQRELAEAFKQHRLLQAKVEATARHVIPNFDKIRELQEAVKKFLNPKRSKE